jgi:hypothetical protein
MRTKIFALAALLAGTTALHAQTFTFTTLDNPGDPTFNQLLGINDKGVIVGYFGSGAAGHPNIGYEIAPPYTKYTPNMQPGSVQTQATGINNAGLTTGFWSNTDFGTNPPSDANFAFLREPTGSNFTYISAIDALTAGTPAVSQALGINNNNVVAGFYNDANGNGHAYTYTLSTGAYKAVNIANAVSAAATSINDSGEVAGFFTKSDNRTFGFVQNATGGVISYFYVPQMQVTQLLGINNSGTAVGFFLDSNNIAHGLYYSSTTGDWVQVNDPDGVGGTVVNGINNKNELVGFFIDAAGNTHGMIVTVKP